MTLRTAAVIVAAGQGLRAGGGIPKQYRRLATGESALRQAVRLFATHPLVGAIQVVVHPDHHDLYTDCLADLDIPPPVHGGARRQDSVLCGLEALSPTPPDYVLIHDAARPFVTPDTISRVIAALDDAPAAIAASPLTDTLKRAQGSRIKDTLSRDNLWRAQTPQGFHYPTILSLHRSANSDTPLTDDAILAERAGLHVTLVTSRDDNMKLTSQDDMKRAQRPTQNYETRIGTGFDVHAFAVGTHVMLCGVRIPHDHSLTGHSDADVALHALTDAVLGALGAHDIGHHFPPSDPQWRGAASERFLSHARDLVMQKGGYIVNVDLTLICEHPKLEPHRKDMIARVASILSIDAKRVGIKATTTERLGFPGRGEGIAAQAAAAIALPICADSAHP